MNDKKTLKAGPVRTNELYLECEHINLRTDDGEVVLGVDEDVELEMLDKIRFRKGDEEIVFERVKE